MVIIKWGSSIYMSADIDVTAVPSLYTQIFLCEIKLIYKQYIIYLLKQIYIYYNELKTTQHGFNIFIVIIVCLIYTCSTFNIKNKCK